jgi:cytochrome o ubiquinol oxidase subunit 1
MVLATMGIAGASWLVWMHHFLTMGQTAAVNSFFSAASMVVGIPTGVKVFNWLFTMWRGRVRLESPMLWAVAATLLLIGGGMTGMMVAIPAINYVTHNSVFVVAHFHNMFMVIAFAIFGGFFFWFPKAYGFKFDERLSRAYFWLFWAGSVFVFVPMYALGFLGMTRRLAYIPNADASWQPLLYAEAFGIALYAASIACFLLLLFVSIRDREINRVRAPDAWGTSRSLEWLTHTPPPAYNFAVLPVIHAQDEWAWRREHGLTSLVPERYTDIHMPKNSAIPVLLCLFSVVLGFALVWRIWWLAAAALLAIVIALVARAFTKDISYVIPAAEVERIENGFLQDEAEAEGAPQPVPANASDAESEPSE